MASMMQKPGSSPPISKKKALREIRRYQRTTSLLIGKAPMQRLIREIAPSYGSNLRIRLDSLLVILEAAEAFLVQMFEEANLFPIHRKRVTVTNLDIGLVRCFMTRHKVFIFNKRVVQCPEKIN